eukprot:1506451-Amphidinium_carterae.1
MGGDHGLSGANLQDYTCKALRGIPRVYFHRMLVTPPDDYPSLCMDSCEVSPHIPNFIHIMATNRLARSQLLQYYTCTHLTESTTEHMWRLFVDGRPVKGSIGCIVILRTFPRLVIKP